MENTKKTDRTVEQTGCGGVMSIDEKLDLILHELWGMKAEISELRADVDELKVEINELKSGLRELQSEVGELKIRVSALEDEINGIKIESQAMKIEIQDLKQRVINVELIIENEIRVHIMRIAEGHMSLKENLDEAKKPNKEIEKLTLRVGILESDVRMVKEKLA